MEQQSDLIKLPPPRQDSDMSVERALRERRSIREFRDEQISLQQLSQLLWAAQGITSREGYRTAPSAGALYPLEVYVLAGNVESLPIGLFRYRPNGHKLVRISNDDRRNQMQKAALGQKWIADSAALIAFASVDSRTTGKYGKRGIGYIHIEVGHVAQNVMLQAVALGLGSAVVGAFDDDTVADILKLPERERPLYLMPIGTKR
jgi:SagB-type dehydrogenase family enzyme